MLQIYNMDLALDSDLYCPSIDANGNYIDKIPSFTSYPNGIKCPCLNRAYNNYASLQAHFKVKKHQEWLSDLNSKKTNYISENIKLNETINNQKLIIAKMEKDIQTKMQTIAFLSQKLAEKEANLTNSVNNLLDFDE